MRLKNTAKLPRAQLLPDQLAIEVLIREFWHLFMSRGTWGVKPEFDPPCFTSLSQLRDKYATATKKILLGASWTEPLSKVAFDVYSLNQALSLGPVYNVHITVIPFAYSRTIARTQHTRTHELIQFLERRFCHMLCYVLPLFLYKSLKEKNFPRRNLIEILSARRLKFAATGSPKQ